VADLRRHDVGDVHRHGFIQGGSAAPAGGQLPMTDASERAKKL
jgi:hypothetical protein